MFALGRKKARKFIGKRRSKDSKSAKIFTRKVMTFTALGSSVMNDLISLGYLVITFLHGGIELNVQIFFIHLSSGLNLKRGKISKKVKILRCLELLHSSNKLIAKVYIKLAREIEARARFDEDCMLQ